MEILFVCNGNHARSQLAEALFDRLSEGKYQVRSAGTTVKTPEKDRDGHKVTAPLAIEVMNEIGIDISDKIRNQLKPEMVEEADVIVVMSSPETIPPYLKESKKAIYWEVPDPYQHPIEFMRDVRNQLQVLISDFIKTLD